MLFSISIEKNLVYIPIFILVNFIFYYSKDNLKLNSKVEMIIRFTSEISLVIFFFLQKFLSRKKIQSDQTQKIVSKKKNENYVIFCMIIFNLLYFYIKDLNIKNDQIEHYIYIILFLYLIDIFILQKQIYSHHILSLILIIIGFFFYIIKNFTFKLIFLIYFMSLYCRSFNQLLIGYISINYFINVFIISTLLGFIGLIRLIIKFLINNDDFIFFPNSINYLLCFYILTSITRSFLYYQIIYKLGTVHVYLCDFISYIIISKLFPNLDENKRVNSSLNYFIIIFLSISTLIYFEILQLNFCSLNKNTKRQLYNRSVKEKISLNQLESLNEDTNLSEIESKIYF